MISLAARGPVTRWITSLGWLPGWLFAAVLLAAGPGTTMTLELPGSFPPDLSTAVSGTLDDETGGRIFKIEGLGERPVIAQREGSGKVVWLVGRISEKRLRGEPRKLAAVPSSAERAVQIVPRDGGFQFLDRGREVMFYQREPVSWDGNYTRAGFVHPLRGLDGEVLTQAFPPDHRHHHGIFWAWHQLWVGDQRAGDPWVTEDFLTVVKQAEVTEQGPVFATLRIEADWTSPRIRDERGARRPIVEERTRIRLFRAAGDVQLIDFEIQLTPQLPGVRIGGAENARGYSGFTVRLKPPEQMQIHDVSGRLSEDGIGRVSPWAAVSGRFGAEGPVAGVAVLAHRSLPEFPPRWLLRHYGAQNVIYPGREPIELEREQPLILRYRLLVHRGNVQSARVADQQTAYQTPAIRKP